MIKFGEFIMILELHRQGLKVAAIARQLGVDRKTVRKYISRGLEPPAYGPRSRRQKSTDPFLPYLRERLAAFPGLTAMRLWRELRERGYASGYTAVKRAVRDIRPDCGLTPFILQVSYALFSGRSLVCRRHVGDSGLGAGADGARRTKTGSSRNPIRPEQWYRKSHVGPPSRIFS